MIMIPTICEFNWCFCHCVNVCLPACVCVRAHCVPIANKVLLLVNLDCQGKACHALWLQTTVWTNRYRWLNPPMTHAGLCDISIMHLIPIGFVMGIKCSKKIRFTVSSRHARTNAQRFCFISWYVAVWKWCMCGGCLWIKGEAVG